MERSAPPSSKPLSPPAPNHDALEKLSALARVADDPDGGHSRRVGKLVGLLAVECGVVGHLIPPLEQAARLHDIGKLIVPQQILLGSAPLTPAAWDLIRTHPIVGEEIIAACKLNEFAPARQAARWHHEWWNGRGYPDGLKGDEIPVAARFTALADFFDAVTHERADRRKWKINTALSELERLAGHQFDPTLTHAFVRVIERLQSDYYDIDRFLER